LAPQQLHKGGGGHVLVEVYARGDDPPSKTERPCADAGSCRRRARSGGKDRASRIMYVLWVLTRLPSEVNLGLSLISIEYNSQLVKPNYSTKLPIQGYRMATLQKGYIMAQTSIDSSPASC
jgi:hypothetical protein